MSINALAIVPGPVPFLLEAGEVLRYSSPSKRQSLSLRSHDSPASLNLSAKDGSVFLTNKRFVFCTASQGDLESFTISFDHLADLGFSHALKSPWFGANYWEFLLYSPPSGVCDGLPPKSYYKGQVYFLDGGLFDFVAQCNEVINDAVNNTHIDEELPRYTP